MRRKEIEKKLNDIISNSQPDVLDNILARCEKNKKNEERMSILKSKKINNVTKESKKIMFSKKLVGAMAIVVLCAGGLLGFNYYNNLYKIDSIVEFDVNPSVEIKVNKNEKVIEVIALNDDGKKVLDDMDFEKVDLDVAVNAIIGSMLKNGYLTINENSILVSVKNNDEKKANKLKEKISEDISALLKASSIDGSILSQTYTDNESVKNTAEAKELSEGKVILINKILKANMKDSKGNNYTFDSLSNLSINELNLWLTTKKTSVENVKMTGGTASEKSYIGKDKAKQIALDHAKVSSSNTKNFEIELDADDGKLVYEIEFDTSTKEYDYEIDAKTGNIIESDVEKKDIDDDKKTNSNNSSNKNNVTSSTNKNNTTNKNNYEDDDDNDYDDDDDDDDRYDD